MATPMELQAGASPGVTSIRRQAISCIEPGKRRAAQPADGGGEHWVAGLGK